jgi:hypothetical protein
MRHDYRLRHVPPPDPRDPDRRDREGEPLDNESSLVPYDASLASQIGAKLLSLKSEYCLEEHEQKCLWSDLMANGPYARVSAHLIDLVRKIGKVYEDSDVEFLQYRMRHNDCRMNFPIWIQVNGWDLDQIHHFARQYDFNKLLDEFGPDSTGPLPLGMSRYTSLKIVDGKKRALSIRKGMKDDPNDISDNWVLARLLPEGQLCLSMR